MAKWSSFYKIISPKGLHTANISDSQGVGGQSYANYTWYQRVVSGSGARLQRYRQYDNMDQDVDVSRALDIIAEEITGNNTKTKSPIDIHFTVEDNKQISGNITVVLHAALRHWIKIHKWDSRLFKIGRHTVKYGDCFFRKRKKFNRWEHIPAKNVVSMVVDEEDLTKIYGYHIQTETKKVDGINSGYSSAGSDSTKTETVPADEIVRFTTNDDMSESAPFGESVLIPVLKTHKQKELLEDSVIIYRISRAPERRIFYIDTGKMPPAQTKQYLESIKNDIKQKKIPSFTGGQETVDSVYNPLSMMEDYFFAVKADSKGSRVETLPGGQNLGELAELDYFLEKTLRGLRVPTSYMKNGTDNQIFSDGKVGTAYIEELRFALFVMRYQKHVEETLDEEFKKYLRNAEINIDPTIFDLKLPEPSNFGKYKDQELHSALLSAYSQAKDIEHLSARFALRKYLQLSKDDISLNEEMVREEKGIKPNDPDLLAKIYNANYDDDVAAGSFGDLGDEGGLEGDLESGDIEGEDVEGGDVEGGETET